MNTSADVHGQRTEGRTCSLGKKTKKGTTLCHHRNNRQSLARLHHHHQQQQTPSSNNILLRSSITPQLLKFFRANVGFASHPPHSFLLYFGFGGGGAFFSKHASIFLWVFSTRSLGVLWLRFLSFFFWCEVEKGEGKKSRKRRKC